MISVNPTDSTGFDGFGNSPFVRHSMPAWANNNNNNVKLPDLLICPGCVFNICLFSRSWPQAWS